MFRIKVEPIPERGTYRFLESVIIEGIEIPEGWEFNGASIPGFLWPVIGTPFHPKFMAPAALHDRVYETGEIPRKEGDKLFRKTLIHNGVDEELAQTMYYGVRVGGAAHYRRKKCLMKNRPI